MKETEKLEENTIYLFDSEPNIGNFFSRTNIIFPEKHHYDMQIQIVQKTPQDLWLKVEHGEYKNNKFLVPVIEYKYAQIKTTNWVCKVPAIEV